MYKAYEVAFAGGMENYSAKAWYYYNSAGSSVTGSFDWWTMTPSLFNPSPTRAVLFAVLNGSPFGELKYNYATSESVGIRPVLSLKSCVLSSDASANGSATKPYKVEITDECKTAEN